MPPSCQDSGREGLDRQPEMRSAGSATAVSSAGSSPQKSSTSAGSNWLAALRAKLRESSLDRKRRAVRAVLDHRAVRVADGDDPCGKRDRGSRDPVRIAAPVPALVRRADDPADLIQCG